jgi:hypothetical protein
MIMAISFTLWVATALTVLIVGPRWYKTGAILFAMTLLLHPFSNWAMLGSPRMAELSGIEGSIVQVHPIWGSKILILLQEGQDETPTYYALPWNDSFMEKYEELRKQAGAGDSIDVEVLGTLRKNQEDSDSMGYRLHLKTPQQPPKEQ